MLQACVSLSTDLRTFRTELVDIFNSLRPMLQEINNRLPARLCLSIVKFTTALGDPIPLPYELCQQWSTFTKLLQVVFDDKPGKARVEFGLYTIINARGGRLLTEHSWQHAITAEDHLIVSIVINKVGDTANCCPFSSCQASIGPSETVNGGRTCSICGRWSSYSNNVIVHWNDFVKGSPNRVLHLTAAD
jgi:hypothetical protein